MKKKKRRDFDGFLTISSQLAPRKKSPTEICGFPGNFSAGKNARVRDFPRASSFFSAKFLDTLLRDQRSRMTDGVDTSMIERFVFFFLLEIIGKLVRWIFRIEAIGISIQILFCSTSNFIQWQTNCNCKKFSFLLMSWLLYRLMAEMKYFNTLKKRITW